MKVLFVCLGNICRSPMAEAILKNKLNQLGISAFVDSAGTANYHEGALPDHRTLKVLNEHQIKTDHKARQIQQLDLETFDMIFAMDKENLKNLRQLCDIHGTDSNTIQLIGNYHDQHGINIPDPYYGTMDDFRNVYSLLENCIDKLISEKFNK